MNFEKKFEAFWRFFSDNGGYSVVLQGLRNTLIIAILGLVIGIIILCRVGDAVGIVS